MPSLHDTRLLSNLLKTEKDALQAFKQYSLTAASAGSALSAWSVADSADTGDLMDAAIRISQLLATCTDSQRLYLHALAAYRASLKDVLAREQALRTVVRDREILVNRLIKVGNKKPKDGHEAEHQAKLDDAQRELQACETFLQEEEAALAASKRRSFRYALMERMKAMGDLARVMEDCSAEAVTILSELPSPDGDDAAQHALHQQYDLGSDAGDSIAPSQSASQAMSRASSSSSLHDLYAQHANAPPIPTDLRIPDSPNRARSARSASPSPARARTPTAARSALKQQQQPPVPQPVMPAVPTAPPPISRTVYTERVAGMPTFDIPRAPDLSRRVDDSSDEDGDEGAPGMQHAPQRSAHYPLDSPPLASAASRPSRLSRRAMSDTGSIQDGYSGGGRKRRGSFFGGIASLFSRNKNKGGGGGGGGRDREPSAGSHAGAGTSDFDYAGARSRLAAQSGAQGGAADDAVSRSVMNAGRLPLRRRGGGGGDDSSDDEGGPTVRHVNDPSARLRALSDIGRPSSPAAAASGRPKLQRKGTSTSTVRPLSVVEAGVAGMDGGAKPKKTRKVKKAASDIGPSSAPPPGWTGSVPSSATLQVPRAPGRGDGIAGLAFGSSLPAAPSPLSAPAPAFAPRGASSSAIAAAAAANGTPAAPAETGELKRKVTKKANGVTQPSETVILSAEALGIPTSATGTAQSSAAATPAGGLSRNNTVSTAAGTIRKKKKPKAAPNGDVAAAQAPPPSADDLAASLPTARGSSSALTAQLPKPDGDSYRPSRPLSVPSAEADNAKPVKALADKEKKSKRLSTLHGVGAPNWVTQPHHSQQQQQDRTAAVNAAIASVGRPAGAPQRRIDVHEGDESLMSVVDRAEGNERTSRAYARPAVQTQGLASPPAGNGAPSLPSPSGALNASLPAAPPAQANLPASNAVLPRPPASDSLEVPTLTKRKSVRLADDGGSHQPAFAQLSPSPSVRSASSAGAGQPPRGILVQRDPSPAPGSVAASVGSGRGSGGGGGGVAWPTRASIRAAMDDDSSDSDAEGRRAYRQARKMLGRGTKDMEDAMAGRTPPTREEKGKGRALD
ncbi:hypothetical protein Rhopal_004895-T1 [Rhodotorula paludigena]|uniref:Uncharacterized protein n=1 Tax=Rhodotorula paludigena TaxID=86838 RepID=A0AAV5GPQ5_9BASI|nr:hypothetical protein Rhopal_004895-T1 [Rhodotorula paludigena]